MSFIYNAGTSGIYNESDEFMAGQIAFCAAGVIPQGWLECNGAAISRATYGTLFAAIGTNYGVGDGATTFNLPDLRGEFIRGADRGRGVDAGRVVGSHQGDAGRNLTGDWYSSNTSAGTALGTVGSTSGVFAKAGTSDVAKVAVDGTLITGTPFGLNLDASRQWPTANEFRPRNVAMVPVIKYS